MGYKLPATKRASAASAHRNGSGGATKSAKRNGTGGASKSAPRNGTKSAPRNGTGSATKAAARNGEKTTPRNGTTRASKVATRNGAKAAQLKGTTKASKAATSNGAKAAPRNGTTKASKAAARNGVKTAQRNGTTKASRAATRIGAKAAQRNGSGDHTYCAALVEGLIIPPGEHFFTTMARSVAVALGARFGFVSKRGDEPGRLELLGLWNGEALEEPFSYQTEDTPCELVLGKNLVSIPKGVVAAYPKDEWLREIGAESYVAVPLVAPNGTALGHIGVIHTARLDPSDESVAILHALATRTAGELQRNNEYQLAEQRTNRVEAIVNKAAVGVIQVDSEGDIVFANPHVETLFGYERGELLGQRLEVLVPGPKRGRHEDDRRHYQRSPRDQIMGAGMDIQGRRKDGTTFPVTVALSADGRAAVAIIADATKDTQVTDLLKQENARLEAVVEAFPEMTCIVDDKGVNIDFVASGLEPHLSRADVVGKSVEDVLPAEVAGQVLRCIELAIRTRKVQSMKYTLDWDDGKHSYEARYVRLSSDRVAVFIRDFTVEEWQRNETKQMEATTQPVDEMEHRMEWRNPYGLSYREFGVLHLLKNGTTDKEIAGELGISVFTVNKHVSNILTKMRAASRTEATIRALQEGLIE